VLTPFCICVSVSLSAEKRDTSACPELMSDWRAAVSLGLAAKVFTAWKKVSIEGDRPEVVSASMLSICETCAYWVLSALFWALAICSWVSRYWL
jgi:hypothetical protein